MLYNHISTYTNIDIGCSDSAQRHQVGFAVGFAVARPGGCVGNCTPWVQQQPSNSPIPVTVTVTMTEIDTRHFHTPIKCAQRHVHTRHRESGEAKDTERGAGCMLACANTRAEKTRKESRRERYRDKGGKMERIYSHGHCLGSASFLHTHAQHAIDAHAHIENFHSDRSLYKYTHTHDIYTDAHASQKSLTRTDLCNSSVSDACDFELCSWTLTMNIASQRRRRTETSTDTETGPDTNVFTYTDVDSGIGIDKEKDTPLAAQASEFRK